MSTLETVDKKRLSQWVLIVLLLFEVAFVVHTHINTRVDSSNAEASSSVKLQRTMASSIRDSSPISSISSPQDSAANTFSNIVENFAAKVMEEASADVNNIISMFKPTDENRPSPFEISTAVDQLLTTSSGEKRHVVSNIAAKEMPSSTTRSNTDNIAIKLPDDASASVKLTEERKKTRLARAPTSPEASSSTISFLDTSVHQQQKKLPTKQENSKQKDEGRISFQDTSSGNLQKQLKPSKQKRSPTHTRAQQQDEDLARIQAESNHPRYSPRPGTNISPENQVSLLLCPNQAKCIVPELQLKKKLKVYLCKHPTRHGVRFYYLAREGLMLHPNVELVAESAIETADFIMYLPGSAPWHLTEIRNSSFSKRLIVLDEFDGHTLFSPGYPKEEHIKYYGGPSAPWYYMYFKRSYVRRLDGHFQGYPHLIQHEVYPLTYSIAEVYIPHHFNSKREIDILCTLRGSKSMTTRLRVQTWVAEYGKERNVQNFISGEVNTATRTTVSKQYFEQMFNAQIIVTVNPANWEGDFRLWESMCTGALVFVDPIFVPHPFPIQDKVHVIFFSNKDRDDLFRKLDYYRANPLEARKIAVQGYLHAMKYHRTVNMIDYILRTAHLRKVAMEEDNVKVLPNYTYTGQFLHYEASIQEKQIKACNQPGIYIPPSHPHEPIKRLRENCKKIVDKVTASHVIDRPLEFLH
jgi:hypothetical protein